MSPRVFSRLDFPHWNRRTPSEIDRAFVKFLLALAVVRLIVVWILPLDLAGDEAYYWEWGRHLDWGYFSKPPGIGWLMALAGWLGGDSTFGIRLFAVLFGTGSLGLTYLLGRSLYGAATGLITALVFAANPANAALNLLLTIDAPLVFFWMLALYAFWRLIQPKTAALGWGSLLTVGLAGGLLSKQIMLAFHPLALLFLSLSNGYRAQLRRPVLWLCLVGSLIAWVPPLWWNSQNHWITLRHTAHHLEAGGPGLARRLIQFLEFVGSQFGLVTPVLCLLLWGLIVVIPWYWRSLSDKERFLWMFSAPGLIGFLILALRQRVQPNWPAVYYGSACLLLTAWAAGHWHLPSGLERWRSAFTPGLRLAVGVTGAVYLVAGLAAFGWLSLPRVDPSARLRGWARMAGDIDKVRQELPADILLIAQGHRYIASELAFYLSGKPEVHLYNSDPTTVGSQYDLWRLPVSAAGRDALIVVQGGTNDLSGTLAEHFASIRLVGTLHDQDSTRHLQNLALYYGHSLKSWPTWQKAEVLPKE